MSQRITRSRSNSQVLSQGTQASQQGKSQVSDCEDNDNEDDDEDDIPKVTKAKKTTTPKSTTIKKTSKKVYPPFTIHTPKLISHNPYIQRPFFGDVSKFTQEIHGFDMTEPCMVGIDEAGRGPVLGPMVYGTCIVPLNKVTELKSLGVNDSKQLKELDREYLFSLVQSTNYLRWIVDRISPTIISSKMLAASKESLNLISHLSALHMVCHYIKVGFNIQEVYADTVGPPDKYKDWMEREINEFCRTNNIKNTVMKVVVESKADATYPCVSAASICAKVTRDLDLAEWVCREDLGGLLLKEKKKKQLLLEQQLIEKNTTNTNDDNQPQQLSTQTEMGDNDNTITFVTGDEVTQTEDNVPQPMSTVFGSGYPGDEVTKTWLRKNFDPIFGFPDLVRFSWGTSEKIIDEDGYSVRWGDEEDLPARDGGAKGVNSKFSFLKAAPSQQNASVWPLMKNNNITSTTDLPF